MQPKFHLTEGQNIAPTDKADVETRNSDSTPPHAAATTTANKRQRPTLMY